MNAKSVDALTVALKLLDLHFDSFFAAAPIARTTGHPVPTDTRGWSQILVSVLSGVVGMARKKGADLSDGSDVKGANTWEAIDTPRFNGVLKAGTKATTAGKITSLDSMPFLYFVLWDQVDLRQTARCRVWVVRPQEDRMFRVMCSNWFLNRERGEIQSNNFQLHPPRGQDSNTIRNTCGNLKYPLFFAAERKMDKDSKYEILVLNDKARTHGFCAAG